MAYTRASLLDPVHRRLSYDQFHQGKPAVVKDPTTCQARPSPPTDKEVISVVPRLGCSMTTLNPRIADFHYCACTVSLSTVNMV